MAFTSYLIDKFAFTHENTFFREISHKLNQTFNDVDGLHILIGNIACDGHMMDAIFIAPGSISVIDFKDYEGDLTFKENNPWHMKTPTGEVIFVKGGAQSRNPLQQVKAYRRSLAEFLASNESKITDKNHTGIEWMHTGSIVLFHRKIKFDQNEVPPKIQRYFHIADINSFFDLFKDLYSNSLKLSTNETLRILDVLGVVDDNLLQKHDFTSDNRAVNPVKESKLYVIKQLMRKNLPTSLYGKALQYFYTLIDVERYKEPSGGDLASFPFDLSQDQITYSVDISKANKFHEIFVRNLEERFPKNIFVALNIFIEGVGYPLLHTIIMASDVSNSNVISFNLNDFSIYQKSLEKLGLSEDIIEELITAVNDASSLDKKIDVVRDLLGLTTELTKCIQIGLSNESSFTLQLASELKRLSTLEEKLANHNLLASFILNKEIKQTIAQLKLDPFVEVSSLNNSQQRAVQSSFVNPLTVITGPPGSGKSQVVINIIANAIINGHSILFASKNNKAVDVVKERLDELLSEPYIIRFGTKDDIRNKAKVDLALFLRRKSQGDIKDFSAQLNLQQNKIRQDILRKTFLISEIARLPKEINILDHKTAELILRKKNLDDWMVKLDHRLRDLFIENNTSVRVDKNEIALLIQKVKRAKSNFLSKLFFNLFSKKQHLLLVQNLNKSFDKKLYDYISEEQPYAEPNTDYIDSSTKNLIFILNLQYSKDAILKSHNDLKLAIEEQENIVNRQQAEVDKLQGLISEYELEIVMIDNRRIENSLELLNLKVHENIRTMNSEKVQQYHDYIPAERNYNAGDIIHFGEIAKEFLQDFNVACITSLSIKNSFPLAEGIADILIIDEASQCDIASALPLLYRAKRAVIIGDPLQLKHITNVQKFESEYVSESLGLKTLQLDYVGRSLYDYADGIANKSKLESVFLKEHYRCHPQIAQFASNYFYEKRLGQSWEIQTSDDQYLFGNKGINWINIEGKMSTNKNTNQAEINAIIELTKKLSGQYPTASIGIICPFTDQKNEIFAMVPEDLKKMVKVDTVHRFQGDEKDIIIFSTVVSTDCTEGKASFINRNEYIINVAITRARSALYIVGNHSYCKKLKNGLYNTPLSNLATYVESLKRLS
jgi:superfamily I DNA and/or RNA helicase